MNRADLGTFFHARRALPVFSFALLLILSACSGEVERVMEKSRSLAQQIAHSEAPASAPPSIPNSTGKPPLTLPPLGNNPILYIDATRSMAGFAGDREPTNYDLVLDRLTTDLSITSVQRFGQLTRAALLSEEPIGRNVHQSAFYDRLQNPDFELYRSFLADSLDRTHIYLTDGVLSAEHGENPAAVVDALKNWLDQGRALAILAFRSRFEGPAWSEQRKRMIGPIKVDDRPFYFIIFAPSETALDDLLNRLSSQLLREAILLRFSTGAIDCGVRKAPLPVITEMITPPWVMLPPDMYRKMTPQNPGIVAHYTCNIDKSYPLKTVRPNLNVRYRQWNGEAFTDASNKLPDGTLFRIDTTATPTGVEAQVSAVLADDPLTRFGFFELAFQYEPGSLKDTVESLSSNSDGHPEDFNRTYRFSWIMDQLVRHQLLGYRKPDFFFLTVQYS